MARACNTFFPLQNMYEMDWLSRVGSGDQLRPADACRVGAIPTSAASTVVLAVNRGSSVVGKPEGNKALGRSRHRWEDNVIMCLGE
jgi:hypothetical protein